MEQIIIRKATQNDLETLLQFEQGIIEAERPYDITLKEEHFHYYDITKMIDADDVEVLVAELEHQLIGSGYVRIKKSEPYLKHQQHGYLGFMYVEPKFRGRGVNQMIVEELKEWSRERNLSELRLDVYDANPAAVRAYEKAGFTKNLVEMRMKI